MASPHEVRVLGVRILKFMIWGRVSCAVFLLATLSAPVWSGLYFEETVQAAVKYSADVQSAQEMVRADEENAHAAGRLPDPQAFIGISNLPLASTGSVAAYSMGQDAMTAQVVGISQDFRNSAQRASEQSRAQAEVILRVAQLEATRVQVRTGAAQAWIACWYAQQRLQVIMQQIDDNHHLVGLVRAQLRSGEGREADALAPQIEAQTLANAQDREQAELTAARAELVRWLGFEGSQEAVGPEPVFAGDNLEQLRSQVDRMPVLLQAKAAVGTAQAELAQADADKIPDWGMSLAYQHRGPAFGDMLSLTVSTTLPVFYHDRQGPRIAAKKSQLAGNKDKLQDQRREKLAWIETIWSREHALGQEVHRLLHDALPLIDQKIALLTSDFRAGKGNIDSIIAARQERRNLLLSIDDLSAQRDSLAAQLHYAFAMNPGESS